MAELQKEPSSWFPALTIFCEKPQSLYLLFIKKHIKSVHSTFNHNSPKVQIIKVSIDGRMGKGNTKYSREYYIATKKSGPQLHKTRWADTNR